MMVSGTKRSHDYTVDDFFTDVKKRRVNPAYDSRTYILVPFQKEFVDTDQRILDMAARLSNLAYQQSLSSATNGGPPPGSHGPQFPPRSISFDIRTPEELAAVNEFLITLGRDVSGPGAQSRHQHSQSVPHVSMNEASFFDPANLAQLGLAGMPGVPSAPGPGSGASYHGESGFIPNEFAHHGSPYPNRSSQQSVQSVQFGLYPTAQDLARPAYTASRVRAHRASATDEHLLPLGGSQYPHQSYSGHAYPHYLTPPLEVSNASASPLSSHSGMSTPPNATPPHIPLTVSPESAAVFDFVRTGHAPPVVQLASVDYGTKNMRTMIPLKSAGPGPGPSSSSSALATRPEPMEPKLGGTVHRGPPARLTTSAASSLASSSTAIGKSSSLYPLLTSGDEQFKLPPLAGYFRSLSPPTSVSVSSREPTLSSSALTLTTRRSPSPLSDGSTPSPKPPPYPTPPLTSALEKEHERDSDVAYPVLPPISSLAASYREHQEELARGVGRIQLESRNAAITPEERGRHAALVRDLLVAINAEYKTRFGAPPPRPSSASQVGVRVKEEPRGLEREVRDVEMIAV